MTNFKSKRFDVQQKGIQAAIRANKWQTIGYCNFQLTRNKQYIECWNVMEENGAINPFIFSCQEDQKTILIYKYLKNFTNDETSIKTI